MSNSGERQSGGSFTTPPKWGSLYDYSDNMVLHVGDSIKIEWSTDLSPVNLYMWQANSTDPTTGYASFFEYENTPALTACNRLPLHFPLHQVLLRLLG